MLPSSAMPWEMSPSAQMLLFMVRPKKGKLWGVPCLRLLAPPPEDIIDFNRASLYSCPYDTPHSFTDTKDHFLSVGGGGGWGCIARAHSDPRGIFLKHPTLGFQFFSSQG